MKFLKNLTLMYVQTKTILKCIYILHFLLNTIIQNSNVLCMDITGNPFKFHKFIMNTQTEDERNHQQKKHCTTPIFWEEILRTLKAI